MKSYMCINNKPISGNFTDGLELLHEGEVYEGYEEIGESINGQIAPILIIPLIDPIDGWDMRRFIPCSEIDELELVNTLEEYG